jgi:carbonic anhydrase
MVTAPVVVVALSLLIAACSQADTETASDEHGSTHWGYDADNGPNNWGSMDSEWALCDDGREQSPIDVANASQKELPDLVIHTPSDREVDVMNQEGVISALDNGHTIQINSKTGETLTVGDRTYALVQFHFHAPSEHTVDGEHFPMEMHFVHQAEDGALAVVGVLIEEGTPNSSLAPIWEQLGATPGSETTVHISAEFADQIFSGEPTGVHHYRGSLTTPPCSEGVNWFVRRTPTQLSKDQIAAFTAIYDHNNRPVQALNNRTLYLDENIRLSAIQHGNE